VEVEVVGFVGMVEGAGSPSWRGEEVSKKS